MQTVDSADSTSPKGESAGRPIGNKNWKRSRKLEFTADDGYKETSAKAKKVAAEAIVARNSISLEKIKVMQEGNELKLFSDSTDPNCQKWMGPKRLLLLQKLEKEAADAGIRISENE